MSKPQHNGVIQRLHLHQPGAGKSEKTTFVWSRANTAKERDRAQKQPKGGGRSRAYLRSATSPGAAAGPGTALRAQGGMAERGGGAGAAPCPASPSQPRSLPSWSPLAIPGHPRSPPITHLLLTPGHPQPAPVTPGHPRPPPAVPRPRPRSPSESCSGGPPGSPRVFPAPGAAPAAVPACPGGCCGTRAQSGAAGESEPARLPRSRHSPAGK